MNWGSILFIYSEVLTSISISTKQKSYIDMCLYTHISLWVCVCMNTNMYACIYVCMYLCIDIYVVCVCLYSVCMDVTNGWKGACSIPPSPLVLPKEIKNSIYFLKYL